MWIEYTRGDKCGRVIFLMIIIIIISNDFIKNQYNMNEFY